MDWLLGKAQYGDELKDPSSEAHGLAEQADLDPASLSEAGVTAKEEGQGMDPGRQPRWSSRNDRRSLGGAVACACAPFLF